MARHNVVTPSLHPQEGDPRATLAVGPCSGKGKNPLGLSFNSRLVCLGIIIKFKVIYCACPSVKLGDMKGSCH